MAMDCRNGLRFAIVLMATCFGGHTSNAQESSATLESVLQRLERVEQDNQILRERVARFEDPASNGEFTQPS
ncbi:MAG: hypothetical protein O2856_18595, partial [Planctomycetota bacterium]|nr:hypothetical protein [Planctomycetota bacterium]